MDTAVALFVFNRPDLTRAAVRRLAAVQPEHILIVADGPRNENDVALCQAVRDIVRQEIVWEARVDFLESAENMGCRNRFESGLDWVFSKVERAIILEDDIEVAASFFTFASKSLEQFERNPDVRMVSGRNVLIEYPDEPTAFLSRAVSIWGWATWANRWQDYRKEFAMADQRSIRDGINRHAGSEVRRRLATHLYESRLWEKIDTWDMPWALWILATGGFCLNPPRNLTANHGMLPDATHTSAVDDVRGDYPLREWNPTSETPSTVSLEEEYDRLVALFDIVLNYEHPRRWKVLARQREHRPSKAEGAGWDVMLIPFDYPADTSKLISRLKRWITSPQLDRLAEIFPDQ